MSRIGRGGIEFLKRTGVHASLEKCESLWGAAMEKRQEHFRESLFIEEEAQNRCAVAMDSDFEFEEVQGKERGRGRSLDERKAKEAHRRERKYEREKRKRDLISKQFEQISELLDINPNSDRTRMLSSLLKAVTEKVEAQKEYQRRHGSEVHFDVRHEVKENQSFGTTEESVPKTKTEHDVQSAPGFVGVSAASLTGSEESTLNPSAQNSPQSDPPPTTADRFE